MTEITMKSITCAKCGFYASLDSEGHCEFCRPRSPVGTIDDPLPGLPQVVLLVIVIGGILSAIVWLLAQS